MDELHTRLSRGRQVHEIPNLVPALGEIFTAQGPDKCHTCGPDTDA